ncbi:MAG: hypothetical protein ABMB14_38845 [Myxococcota bacterium]
MRAFIVGCGWVAIAGCGVPAELQKEDFADRAADAVCRRTRECDRGAFDTSYFGLADCRATVSRDLRAFVGLMDETECEYDGAKASDAYTEVLEMSCEDFYEGEFEQATSEIWGDCGFFTFPTTSSG